MNTMNDTLQVTNDDTLSEIERSIEIRRHGEQAGTLWAQLAVEDDIIKCMKLHTVWVSGRSSIADWVAEYVGDILPDGDQLARAFGAITEVDADCYAFAFLDAVVAYANSDGDDE